MDITQAETIAVAIVGLVAPVIVQSVKPVLPENMTALFSLAVSLILGVLAIGSVGGFNHGYSWGVLLVAVVGVSQTVYTTLNQVLGGKLGKTFVDFNKGK